jgi:hypothetical protein
LEEAFLVWSKMANKLVDVIVDSFEENYEDEEEFLVDEN